MKTLIIHPGAPKTATSTLQHILRANRGVLARKGIGMMLPEDIRGHGLLGHYMKAYRGKAEPDVAATAAEFFRPFRNLHDTVVLSEETLCHDFMPSRKFADGGIDRAEAAAGLISQFGFDRVQVVLSIRPQYDLLTSTYTHFVHRHRETRGFADWLHHEVAPERLLWGPAIAAFRARFGGDNVHVVGMTGARPGGIGGYMAAMVKALGLDGMALEMSTDKVHNPSPSARAVQLCRVMNREILNQKKSETVNSFLVGQFPVADFGKFTTTWQAPDQLAALWAADYAAACAQG